MSYKSKADLLHFLKGLKPMELASIAELLIEEELLDDHLSLSLEAKVQSLKTISPEIYDGLTDITDSVKEIQNLLSGKKKS